MSNTVPCVGGFVEGGIVGGSVGRITNIITFSIIKPHSNFTSCSRRNLFIMVTLETWWKGIIYTRAFTSIKFVTVFSMFGQYSTISLRAIRFVTKDIHRDEGQKSNCLSIFQCPSTSIAKQSNLSTFLGRPLRNNNGKTANSAYFG